MNGKKVNHVIADFYCVPEDRELCDCMFYRQGKNDTCKWLNTNNGCCNNDHAILNNMLTFSVDLIRFTHEDIANVREQLERRKY